MSLCCVFHTTGCSPSSMFHLAPEAVVTSELPLLIIALLECSLNSMTLNIISCRSDRLTAYCTYCTRHHLTCLKPRSTHVSSGPSHTNNPDPYTSPEPLCHHTDSQVAIIMRPNKHQHHLQRSKQLFVPSRVLEC